MPNNLQILAYVQCLKDQEFQRLQNAIKSERENQVPYPMRVNVASFHRKYLTDLENLEKFIRGENHGSSC